MHEGDSFSAGTLGKILRFDFQNYWSGRLQNSPYFCVFKYARAVKQKVWNEAENRERDWGETLGFARVRLLRHALPISFTDFEKKTDCFAVYWSGHGLAGHSI